MKGVVFFILLSVSSHGFAEWTLSNKASSFNYFGSKNNIVEVNSFTNIDGSISDQGKLVLKIDLSSIETNNTRDNLQIQELLLETKQFQEAVFSFDLGENFLQELDLYHAKKIVKKAVFIFHGIAQKIDTIFLITRIKNDFLIVKTFQPIMLNLTDYGLNNGLDRLRQVKTFKNITNHAPLSLNLFFSNQ